MRNIPKAFIMDIAAVVVLAVLLIGIATFAAPCAHEDGSQATCAAATQLVMGLAIAALVLITARQFIPVRTVAIVTSIVAMVLGIVIALTPGTILPLCDFATMRCQSITMPFVQITGALVALLSLLSAVMSIKRIGQIEWDDIIERR